MNNFIRIDRRKHESFLADHCFDPTTKELLKVGDEVCICVNCKSPHLKSVWQLAKRCPSCGNESKRTLSEIPKTSKYTHFSKKSTTIPVVQNSFRGYFIFFLITTIIIGVISFNFYREAENWKSNYSDIYNEKNNLNSQITSLTNTIDELSSEKIIIQGKLDKSSSKLYELNSIISKLTFTTGIKYDDRKKYSLGYGDNKAKVYFTVYHPIVFKSVKIDANGSGYLRGYIYDINDNKICEAYNGEITKGVESLSFNCNLDKGKYYLTHTGNTPMFYISNFNKYPISDKIISITGTQYKSKYYMNFFEWSYKLNVDGN